jgi:GNAT superfamily N-acetyltransferase
MCVLPVPVPDRATGAIAPVAIRPAIGRDCAALTAMVRQSGAYHGRYHVMVANQTIDVGYLQAHPVRVAVIGAEVVGFYSLLVAGCRVDGEGELDFMFVADRHQGRGVGRQLFDDLRQMAASLGLRRIHIVSHPPAERFYRARGAERVGEVPPSGGVTWSRPHLLLSLDLLPSPDSAPIVGTEAG